MSGYDHTISEDATRRVVDIIDSLTGDDPEMDHGTVDTLLLDIVPPAIEEAVRRLQGRATWWATA